MPRWWRCHRLRPAHAALKPDPLQPALLGLVQHEIALSKLIVMYCQFSRSTTKSRSGQWKKMRTGQISLTINLTNEKHCKIWVTMISRVIYKFPYVVIYFSRNFYYLRYLKVLCGNNNTAFKRRVALKLHKELTQKYLALLFFVIATKI